MDTQGMVRSERNDGNNTIIELASTGGNTSEQIGEVLPSSSVQQGTGSPTNNASSTPKRRDSDSTLYSSAGGQKKRCCGLLRPGGRKKSKEVQLGKQRDDDGLTKKREAMMLVSVLIATLTYQAALNPPGGFWQDAKPGSAGSSTAAAPEDQDAPGPAGTAINRDFNGFQWFLIANTVALFASLVNILFLTSAKTLRWRCMMWLLMALMWISVFSVAFSFFWGVLIILRDLSYPAVNYLIYFGLGCMVLFALLVLLHAFIGLKKVYRWLKPKQRASPSLSNKTT
ncbi:uncharacterized protein LOC116247522 isoform X2 [Nymphaea colorata]|uniref:uncharacterized protein LOC116247522 isoform X2 n=1 Tax=Nymphaea colorata TaxID=210225 RepID=UPI00214E83F4|nr:uncharacterized protein LOC116247522 isoform X2 [Nymphaea colorata]